MDPREGGERKRDKERCEKEEQKQGRVTKEGDLKHVDAEMEGLPTGDSVQCDMAT